MGAVQPPWGIAAQENRWQWLLYAMVMHILNRHAKIPCLPWHGASWQNCCLGEM